MTEVTIGREISVKFKLNCFIYLGRFILPVSDFVGQHVKDADKNIIKMLKDCGRLVHSGTVKHSYPFCWRSETPLIYRAVPSWFIRVEQMSQQLLDNNQKTYWYENLKKCCNVNIY